MEITKDVKKQIRAFAQQFTGSDVIHFHQFANRPGHMLVIETRNIDGFVAFLQWMGAEIERPDIKVIRTLPEDDSPFLDLEQKTIGFFHNVHNDFQVATEINDGRISHMKKDYEERGKTHAV